MSSPTLHSTVFPLFTQLPTELRLKIWEYCLPTSRILKITYSPSQNAYISNTAAPNTLHINQESRSQTLLTYSFLHLGPSLPSPKPTIPINFAHDTLYISNLAPILQTHLHDLLYNLSTSPSRHKIRSLAIDRRVWNELCENGLLGVLCRMRALRKVCMVVEFGRAFEGPLGFLEAPEWRGDLRWVAEMAGREVGEERKKIAAAVGDNDDALEVKCVILTRGGEQA